MSLKFTVVDAFTDKPFSGNPAAVVILPSNPCYLDVTLLGIAAEMNLSETAYVIEPPMVDKSPANNQPPNEPYVSYGLRWFTPSQEFPLCGHATLATASVLFADESRVPSNVHQIRFTTLSGILTARRIVLENLPPRYELELPAGDIIEPSSLVGDRIRETVVKATHPDVGVKFVGVSRAAPYEPYLLVEIDERVPLEEMKVNSGILGTLAPEQVVNIVCQRPASGNADFHYRVFAAAAGLIEDPVCGSATSFAAKYLAARVAAFRNEGSAGSNGSTCVPVTASKSGDGIVMKLRAVSRRGGDIELVWDENTGRAKIRGNARVASRGEIYV